MNRFKISSYLQNFQSVIKKFFSLFSFHFLWDSIYIYFSNLYIYFTFRYLWWTINFFPKSFHSYFLCLYLTYSIFFSFMNIRIIVLVSILMSFPANDVMYILTVFLLTDFSLTIDSFLLLCISEFFFLFKWLYFS